MTNSTSPVHVFISYSRADVDLLEGLRKQFTAIERSGLVDTWYDGEIEAGSQWGQVTKNALHRAEVILLLISADFIACDQCYDKEMEHALELHDRGEAIVIPVILRDCTWQFTPFAKLQCLPKNGIPVTDSDHWKSTDKAFKEVVDEVAAICIQLRNPQNPAAKVVLQGPTPKKEVLTPSPQSTGDGGTGATVPVKWLAGGGGALLLVALLFFFFRSSNDKPTQERTKLEAVETTATTSQSTSKQENKEEKRSTGIKEEESRRLRELELKKEERIWNLVKQSRKTEDLEKYLYNYPEGKYAEKAKEALEQLKEKAATSGSSAIRNSTSFTDERDGQRYRIMNHGGLIWMVDNLRYKPTSGKSWCYSNQSGNCSQLGRLYDFDTAKKVCPLGWRLPTDKDWELWANKFGGAAVQELNEDGLKAYGLLIKGGRVGFDARLGGYYDGKFKRFRSKDQVGRYWTSTHTGSDEALFYEFRAKDKKLKRERHYQVHGLSCRCVYNNN